MAAYVVQKFCSLESFHEHLALHRKEQCLSGKDSSDKGRKRDRQTSAGLERSFYFCDCCGKQIKRKGTERFCKDCGGNA